MSTAENDVTTPQATPPRPRWRTLLLIGIAGVAIFIWSLALPIIGLLYLFGVLT